MQTEDSKKLIDKILTGDASAFGVIVRTHERLVSHIVFRIVNREADREDVCQDIFVKVYRNLPKFQFESKLSTWIGRIAYNTCLNYLKKKKAALFDDCLTFDQPMDNYLSDLHSPEQFAAETDLNSRLHEEIEKLPVQFRTILTLYHLDELLAKLESSSSGDEAADPVKFKVDKLTVENGNITVTALGLGTTLPMPAITLKNIGGEDGTTAGEAFSVILSEIFSNITGSITAVPKEFLKKGVDALKKLKDSDVLKDIKDSDALKDIQDSDAAKDVGKKIKGFFGK